MKEEMNEETFFYEIMSKSKLAVPFSDFDDQVMRKIDLNIQNKRSITRYINLSWIFFVAGTAFGIVISAILSNVQNPIFGIPPDRLLLPFQLLFAFLLVTQISHILDFYRNKVLSNRSSAFRHTTLPGGHKVL